MSKRYLESYIASDLQEKKMVLLGGPRQVGKSYLTLDFLKPHSKEHPAYLNWDTARGKDCILSGQFPPKEKLWVLDEIHKYPRWKNLLKGLYDQYSERHKILVTGSAKLDTFRKGGDSLVGRYHAWTLHPFSLGETHGKGEDLARLLKFGGFPEPFLKQNEVFHRRWYRERISQVVRDDIRDLKNIRELALVEVLIETLHSRVGSLLSIQSLAEDLHLAFETVESWIQVLEKLFLVYRLRPWGLPHIRAVKKAGKLYFWDWSRLENMGTKFENLVASQLLKYCDFTQQSQGCTMELKFYRDTEKREVDFIVLKDKKPQWAVECKCGEREISVPLHKIKKRLPNIEAFQVHLGSKDFLHTPSGIRVLPFTSFVKEKSLP